MAKKLEPISDEFQKLFNHVLDTKTSIPEWINFKLLHNNDQKDVYKIIKTNDLTKYLSNIEIVIIFNETIINRIPDTEHEFIIEEALSGITYDLDKETITINDADFKTFKGLIKTYGIDKCLLVDEIIASVKAAMDEEAEQAKNSKPKNFKK